MKEGGGRPKSIAETIESRSFGDLPFSICITDPNLEDNPIVYVNDNFVRVTGYSSHMAIGRNCRFLQGEDTNEADRDRLRTAITEGREVSVDIRNYRADGSPFVNRLLISPLHDDDGDLSFFLGIQLEHDGSGEQERRADELDKSLREVQHRVKNHLQLLLGLIRMESRKTTDPKASLDILGNRVEALNLLYQDFAKSGTGKGQTVGLGAYISRVASALNMLDGHRDIVVNIEVETFEASIDAASHVGLLVSELMTNALQHAFDPDEQGRIEIRLRDGGDHVLLEVDDDGHGLPDDSDWPKKGNLGARIVRDLVASLKGKIEVNSSSDGTVVGIRIPKRTLRER
ncbi:PAS domain-containing protein [Sphingomicrobium sp. XHP0239]|uniref:PAS domain-containing protein n=1 Tax=Sphingomicrobium maritimum TaxID=3133972 RepID=UPI0031CC3DA5